MGHCLSIDSLKVNWEEITTCTRAINLWGLPGGRIKQWGNPETKENWVFDSLVYYWLLIELRFLTNAAFRVSLLSDADTDLVYYKISGPNIFYRNFISKWAYFLLKAKFQVFPHGVQFLEQWTLPNNELNLTQLELRRSWVVFGNSNKVYNENYLREIIPNVWRFIYEFNLEDSFSRLTKFHTQCLPTCISAAK